MTGGKSHFFCLTYSTNLLHPCFLAPLCALVCPFLAPSPNWPPDNLRHPSPSSALCPLLSPPSTIVTVQIYLNCSAKRTGTSGSPVASASAVTARSAANPRQTPESSKASTARKSGSAAKVPPIRKPPNFNLQLRKSGSLSSYSALDTPSYRSPIKSPSQYFQICY